MTQQIRAAGRHLSKAPHSSRTISSMPKQNETRDYRKPCTLCKTPRDVLIRCQIDESGVSGGVVDGDGAPEHKWYRYGGMWKNKHEAVSAKKPKAKKGGKPEVNHEQEQATEGEASTGNEEAASQSVVVNAP
ncbi:hypothetical protein LTR97_005390 [Elasticomyces elasticus]|uniref:Uncharacterized protein n=1 Tax=Elasticomyces elasticus TaxID=574655 RepID=A0AAN7WKS4_9PEZI|nr:hypothetical protein LTR97_005390 [Elasticomyces elasticus]